MQISNLILTSLKRILNGQREISLIIKFFWRIYISLKNLHETLDFLFLSCRYLVLFSWINRTEQNRKKNTESCFASVDYFTPKNIWGKSMKKRRNRRLRRFWSLPNRHVSVRARQKLVYLAGFFYLLFARCNFLYCI